MIGTGGPATCSPAALDGLVVVEFGARIGAAVCGSLLAQLGATVIAVETGGSASSWLKTAHRDQLMAGKLSLCCVSREDALRVRDLATGAHVILTSSDVDESDMSGEGHAGQIVCDITAFGATGPRAGEALSDQEVQALTGLAYTTGLEDGDPVVTSIPLVEYMTGINAACAVLAAERVRRAAGGGQRIDMALYDSAFASTSSFLTRLLLDGNPPDVRRVGSRHPISAPWNVYRAADGWVLICTGSNVQWQRLCRLMEREDLLEIDDYATSAGRVERVSEVDREVASWVGALTVEECVAQLSSASIAGGPISPVEDYPREDNLIRRGMILRKAPGKGQARYLPASPLRMSRTPGRAELEAPEPDADRERVTELLEGLVASDQKAAAGTPDAPLIGIRVVEIGHYTTAPAASRVLAGIGAEVIKIEPPEGEAARAWPPIDRGQSVFYTISNSDKRSVTLDLNTSEGCRQLRELLRSADVLVENLKPGALAKRGFGPLDLESINPRLVYCGISGFGAEGLYPGRPAFDTVVQGMGGLMDLTRSRSVPLKTGISAADVMGASTATVCILAALLWRDSSGLGQAIDLSMQDIVAWSTQLAWNGRREDLPKAEVVADEAGHVLVVSPPEGSSPTPSTARRTPILRPIEVLAAEQTRSRGLILSVTDERGEWPALACPLRLLGTPPSVRRPAPSLGWDNPSVLAGASGSAYAAHHDGTAGTEGLQDHQ